MLHRKRWIGTLALAAIVAVFAFGFVLAVQGEQSAGLQSGVYLMQDDGPEIAVMPGMLNRLSWGAVIAGSIIAIIIQLALNLLAISVGATSINPEYG